MEKIFNVEREIKNILKWIKEYFKQQPTAKGVVIGISGGKDSTIVAKLLVEALGRDRVFGVLMPNGVQKDIKDSLSVVNNLNIDYTIVNIADSYDGLLTNIEMNCSEQSLINIAPRLRMTTLYAIAQTKGYRVVNTCNLSEDYVGYATKFGDSAGDFAPIANFTVEEILMMGDYLGLNKELVYKTPSDGLCGKTDEDNLGFSYSVLDKYIRTGICKDNKIKELIDKKHKNNLHKLLPMPRYER